MLTVRGERIAMTVDTPEGPVTFDGTLNANGQSLQGTLIYHHGEKFPFHADKRPPTSSSVIEPRHYAFRRSSGARWRRSAVEGVPAPTFDVQAQESRSEATTGRGNQRMSLKGRNENERRESSM
jgi:hypothetical protein